MLYLVLIEGKPTRPTVVVGDEDEHSERLAALQGLLAAPDVDHVTVAAVELPRRRYTLQVVESDGD